MQSNNSKIAFQQEPEQLEGLDDSIDVGGREYPIDSVLIRTEHRTIHDVVRRMKKNIYILDPEFQRDFIWDDGKQSKLIESLLMRIPLPVFYLAEQADGRIVVVDGLQRLRTIRRFLDEELTLKDTQTGDTLNGKQFSTLPPKLQARIEDSQLTLYLIDSKVPERTRLDIFDRVNSGVPLTRQQMRNSLYSGAGTRWLKNEVLSNEFQTATASGLKASTMRDREVVNRFCGFYLLGVDAYKGDMDDFLAEALKKLNKLSDDERSILSKKFRKSMEINYQIFGEHAFRKYTTGTLRKSVINIALFDILSVKFADPEEVFKQFNQIEIHNRFLELMANTEFQYSISNSTNSIKQVTTRFNWLDSALSETWPKKHWIWDD